MASSFQHRTFRSVNRILPAYLIDMNGTPVHQPLPGRQLDHVDPFLLLHHHHQFIEPGQNPRSLGVGPHPHRGFSPVTLIYKGAVHHRDSRGNDSVVVAGGVQWMQAGMGIIHSERPSVDLARDGGEQEIIQLWINTPQSHKMDQPVYIAMPSDQIPHVTPSDEGVQIRVIAGNYKDVQGFQHPYSPLIILDIVMEKNASLNLDIPEPYNFLVYNLYNRIDVEGFGLVDARHLVWFRSGEEPAGLVAMENTRLLVLAGIPLGEPIQAYGPFVLNNQTQIMEAIRDYQMGKMGILIEE